MLEIDINKFNHILEGLCITANALEPEQQPQFGCYVERLDFNTNLPIDENFKQFFTINSSLRFMKKMCDDSLFIDWQFHIKNMGTPTETVNYFFRRNLFSTLNDKQFAVISGYLKLHIEDLIGELISSQQGYIRPPNKYLPRYVQHWQHLYLKGKDAEILITFEANT